MNHEDEHDGRLVRDQQRIRLSRRGFLTGSSAALATTGIAAIGSAVVQDASAAVPLQATPEAQGAAAAQGGLPDLRAAQFFNLHEAATVDAIASRLMPGDADDPGAHEAGVVFYIDRSLHGTNLGYTLKTYTQGPFLVTSDQPVAVEAASIRDIYDFVSVASDQASRYGYQSVLTPQEIYRRGIGFLDAYAQDQFQKNFVDLSTEEQDQILTDMEADKATGFTGPSGKAFFTQLRNDTIAGMFSDPMYGGNLDMVGWKLIGYPGAQRNYTPDDIKNTSFMRAPQSLGELIAHEGH